VALLGFNKARLNRFAGRAVARYVEFVHRTSRIVSEPADLGAHARASQPFILAMWHGQFMMLPKVERGGVRIHSMVARHGDAELIGQVLEHFQMDMIRGSGAGTRQRDRGGATALRAALRALAAGESVAMTADVPPGPARIAGTGIVTLARLSGRPIIPVAVATSAYLAFDTWSRMTLNLPFGTLAAVAGEPLFVPEDANGFEIEQARGAVERALDAVTLRAYALAGADPRRATPEKPDRDAPPAMPGFSLNSYRRLTELARPLAPLLLKARERRGKEDSRRSRERLGEPTLPRPEGCLAWVHAASVGETNAILPLIPALRAERPGIRFLLTTGTVTSAEVAARRLAPGDCHQYLPLDVPRFVQNFLDHWRPDLAVLTESEIWPNLILATADRGIPLALANARMSKRSFQRWRRSRGASRPIFNRFAVVLAQNELLARRFAELGARTVITAGNLKIDAPPPAVEPREAERLKSALGRRPHILAASTHEGEEEVLATAHRLFAADRRDFLTIIVPRHPERGSSIADLMRRQGLLTARRSLGALPEADTQVYIADTLGELGTFYAISPIAFIGGSLIAHGGQNPIEAVRHGAAVITGPHRGNFGDAYRALFRHRAAIEVRTARELAAAAAALLDDEIELARMRSSAQKALESLSGALERTVEALLRLLPGDEGLRRAS
jgi:3-deoxy-D-manno-octulosonic-acid transferase